MALSGAEVGIENEAVDIEAARGFRYLLAAELSRAGPMLDVEVERDGHVGADRGPGTLHLLPRRGEHLGGPQLRIRELGIRGKVDLGDERRLAMQIVAVEQLLVGEREAPAEQVRQEHTKPGSPALGERDDQHVRVGELAARSAVRRASLRSNQRPRRNSRMLGAIARRVPAPAFMPGTALPPRDAFPADACGHGARRRLSGHRRPARRQPLSRLPFAGRYPAIVLPDQRDPHRSPRRQQTQRE